MENEEQKSEKNWIVTLLLCWFLGVLGVHRFYAGKIGSGVFQFLTLGGFFIWSFIDLIMIVVGKFKDGEGKLITNK
jgi:TM2 domain-containing membrane protein YozV